MKRVFGVASTMMLAHYIMSSLMGGKYAKLNDDPRIHQGVYKPLQVEAIGIHDTVVIACMRMLHSRPKAQFILLPMLLCLHAPESTRWA
jgi:hypothetical protein